LAEAKQGYVEQEIRSKVLNAFVDASDLEAPEKLVESEFEHRLGHLEADLREHGLTLNDYMQQVQLTELELRADVREQAQRSVKAELLLEEVVRNEKIEVDQEDLSRQIALLAAQVSRDPQEVAQEIVKGGRLGAVAADVLRRKALDWVADNVKVIGLPTDAA
jgi:trigger factor